MADRDLVERFRRNERLATLVNHLLVSLMLACLLVSIVQLGEYLFSRWQGDYLVWFGFFVVLEGLYSWRGLKHIPFLTPEWLLYRGTEWVLILLTLKIILYALSGFNQLWIDISLGWQNFLNQFFDGEFIISVFLVFLVWSLAGMFAEKLALLEGDEKLLAVERETGIHPHRPDVRRGLVDLILAIGGLMILLAAFMRMDWEALWGKTPPQNVGVINVLAYFVLALVLLSLTQFSILRARWGLERIPISPNLGGRWAIYSLGLLLFLGLLALLLPTHYSLGLLQVLGFLIAVVASLLSLVAFLAMLPLILLFSLLGPLFGRTTPLQPIKVKPPILPAGPAGGGPSWLELLKSTIFWLVLIGIIGYSIYHYLGQHGELAGRLRSMPLLKQLFSFWRWLKSRLQGLNRALSAAVEARIQRLQARQKSPVGGRPWDFINLRRLSPRQRVLFFYLAMLRRGREEGMPRKPAQTPYEYAQTLQGELPQVDQDVASLTEGFVEARYSRHEITPQRASLIQHYWQRIRRALRNSLRS